MDAQIKTGRAPLQGVAREAKNAAKVISQWMTTLTTIDLSGRERLEEAPHRRTSDYDDDRTARTNVRTWDH